MAEKNSFPHLKLKIEMVPRTLWNINLRYLLTVKKWQQIRKNELKRCVGEQYFHHCEICKRPKNTLDCHEIWHYDYDNKLQTLNGLIMLCKQCHLIKHIGFATNLAMDGNCNFEGLIRHFCWVNNTTSNEFLEHYLEELDKWKHRSQFEWKQNLKYIVEYPMEMF